MVSSLVLDTQQRIKYRHCYKRNPEELNEPVFYDDQILMNAKAR